MITEGEKENPAGIDSVAFPVILREAVLAWFSVAGLF